MITCDQGSHFVHPISVVPDEDGGGHVDGQGSLATQVAHLPAQPLHLGLGVTRHLLCHDSKRPVQNQWNDDQTCIMTRFVACKCDADWDKVRWSKESCIYQSMSTPQDWVCLCVSCCCYMHVPAARSSNYNAHAARHYQGSIHIKSALQ